MSLPAKTSADRPGARLKHPTGWFAAGREVSRALQVLSDGAFKLSLHLCLKADRSTGQYKGDHADLVKALGKSLREKLCPLALLMLQRQVVQALDFLPALTFQHVLPR